MGAELRRTELAEGILLLSKLSAYLDELGKDESASWIRKVMHDLQEGPSRKREVEICRNLVESLDNGPGRIPDLYFAGLDGKPDISRTDVGLSGVARPSLPVTRPAPDRSDRHKLGLV